MVFVFLPPYGGEPEGTCTISIANTYNMSSLKKLINVLIYIYDLKGN